MPAGALATGLRENTASGIAYITFIPAVVLLITAPYSDNLTVRFHAWQSIFLNMFLVGSWLGLFVLGMIPVVNLLEIALIPLFAVGFFAVWIILLLHTFTGKTFRLPFLSELAERQASAVAPR